MLFLDLKYNVKKNSFIVETNMKDPKDIVETWIRAQMGKGVDNSKANELDEYHIHIDLDLTEDIFNVTHDCGNKGLREGILMEYIKRG